MPTVSLPSAPPLTANVDAPSPGRLQLGKALARCGGAVFGSHPWPRSGRVGRLAFSIMSLTALMALVGAIVGVIGGAPLYADRQNDFLAYLTGAEILASGEAARLFDGPYQVQVQRALLGMSPDGPEYIAYMNPPLWAAMVIPLLPLGAFGSAWLWRILSLVVSAGVLFAIARHGAPAAGWQRATLGLLTFFPFVQFWQYGNMGAVLLVGFGGWLTLSLAGRPFAAGALLSLLLLKPQYAIFPLLYLLWKRQWRQLKGWALGAAAQGVLTVSVYHAAGGVISVDALAQYIAFNLQESDLYTQGQVSLRAAVRFLATSAPPAVEHLLFALAAGLLTVGALRAIGARWPADRVTLGWEALAVAAMMNLTAAHNQLSGLVLLLPPLALLLPGLPGERRDGQLIAALAAVCAAPSVGILLVSFGPAFYALSGWVAVVGALGLALVARGLTQAQTPPDAYTRSAEGEH